MAQNDGLRWDILPGSPKGLGQQQDAIKEQRAANSPGGLRWDILPGSQRQQNWADPSAPGQIAQAPRRPLWDTGGRTGSIQNGWDTPFYETFFKQQEEAVEKGTLGQLYRRQDFTGIVTYDGAKDAQGRVAKFGDMYDGGKLLGNVRELYSRPEADEILATITLDPVTRREMYRDMSRGDLDAVSRAVDAEAAAETARQRKFLTQQDYNDDVAAQRTEFEGGTSLLDEALTALGGALGGAATMWWAGPWGWAAGAVGGAGAALLNQDEILDQAARAKVQQDMAGEQFGAWGGASTALLGWSGLAGKFIQPLTNLAHGAYDGLSRGDIGDNESQWYATDAFGRQERPAWLTGLGVVAGFGDAAMQFGSGVGRLTYMGQMGAQITGRVSQLSMTGGQAFSDSRGAFDNVFTDDEGNFDPVSAAAGIGSVAIDAVQMGAAGGISRMFRNNALAVRAGLGGQTVQVGGRSVKLDAEGVATWARGGNKWTSANMSMLAPSEQLTAISTRVQAARLARMRGGGAVTADDYYRAATRISEGGGKWGNALVTGVGEGYEEFVQGVLDPLSFNDEVNWRQAYEAGLAGFAMGTGMQVGSGLARVQGQRQPSADEKAYARAVLARRQWVDDANATPEQVLSRAEWERMSPSQKQAASKLSVQESQLLKESFQRFVSSQAAERATGRPEVEKVDDARRAVADQESAKAGARTDGSFVITQAESVEVRGDEVVASLDQVVKLMRAHAAGLREQATFLQRTDALDPARQAGAAAELARNEVVVAEVETLVQALQQHRQRAAQFRADKKRQEFRAEIRTVNETLRRLYDLGVTPKDSDPAKVEARRRAATLVFVRNPQDQTGSYQAFVPQVSADLTWANANDVLQVSHAVLQAFGGDFDGDKIVQQAKLILDDAAFANLRSGRNLVGALRHERVDPNGSLVKRDGTIVDPDMPTVNVATRDYEKAEVNILAGALAASANTAPLTTAGKVVQDLVDAIEARYQGKIDGLVLFPITERLRKNLESGNVDARQELLSDMVDQGGDQFWQVSMDNASNELLWLDHQFHTALQGFQSWNARHTATKNPDVNTEIVHPVQRNTVEWSIMQQAAATEGQTLALRAEGWTLFRMFQKLHYSAYLANVQGAGESAMVDALRDLQTAYEALSQGISQSALDATGARDVISQKVIARLQKIALRPDAPARDIAAVANMAVADITVGPNGEPRVGDKPITMLQLLLRQAVNEDRHDKAGVISPELEAKWGRMDQLVRPGASGEAFVEMLGPMTLWELLGTKASSMGPQLTVEQFTRLYIAQGPEARRITSQRLRLEPAYGSREGRKDLPYEWAEVEANQITTFRSVVEAIIETGNNRVTLREKKWEDPKTGRVRLAGTASGRLGRRSDMYQDALEESFTLIQQAFTDMGWDPADGTQVRALFDRHQDFARGVLDLIPNADVNGVFDVVDGQLRVANWVYEMLAMAPAEAAMHYWRNLTIAQWYSRGARHGEEELDRTRTYDSLDNRIHRLMFQLQHSGDGGMALAEFIRVMETSKDLDSFMAYVNTRVRPSSEPAFVAWVQDVSEFAPDKANGGWSSGGSGTQQREAILVLRQRADQLVREIAEEKNAAMSDRILLDSLLAAQERPREAGDGERGLLIQLQNALDFSKEMLTAEGPNSMREQMLGTLRSFYPQAHTKGISPDAYLAAGAFQALADVAGYSTQYERLRDTLISIDADDLGANPQVLAHDEADSMAADGASVAWQGMTVEKLLQLWKRSGDDALPLIRAMLFPSVYEKNAAGRLSQQFLTGYSLSDLLSRDTYQSFYKNNAESKMTYLSMVEALGKNEEALFVVQRPMNDILLAHTTSAGHTLTAKDHEKAIDTLMLDMADIGRMVGDVYSNLGETGLAELRKKLVDQLNNRRGSSILNAREEDRKYVRFFFEYEAESRKQELLAQAEQKTKEGDPQAAKRLVDMANALDEKISEVLDSTEFSRYRDAYRIDWDDATTIDAKKMQLQEEALSRFTELNSKTPWAQNELFWLQNPVRTVDGVPVLNMDPKTDQAMWDKLLDALTAAKMVDATSMQAAGIPVPELQWGKDQVRRYWDPTFSYLVDFLDPTKAFAKTALLLHERTFGPGVANHTVGELESKINSAVLDQEKLGDWTADIVTVSREANQRLDASAAGDAIAMAGIAPRNQFTISVATERTSKTDALAATTSVGTIPLEVLASNTGYFRTDLALADFTDDQVTGSTVVPGVLSPVTLLNGRFAKGARLMYNGQQVADLWALRVPALGRTNFDRPEVVQSGYRAISVRQLRRAAEAALPANADLSKVTVEIDYLHPDSQPAKAGYYNSVFYEGVSFEANADQMRSLNATLWFGAGSISPDAQAAALGANKKGKMAYSLGKAFTSSLRKSLDSRFSTDMSGLITEKALALVRENLGNGSLDPTFFNAVMKDVKLRHFVRGRVNGNMVLWSAEQVIAWQRRNPNTDISTVLEGAELWKPTARVLRTMFGETGDRGVRGALQQSYELDEAAITRYQGVTDEMLARVPGWAGSTDIFNTSAAARTFQGRFQLRPVVTEDVLRKLNQGIQYRHAARLKIHDARREHWSEGHAAATARDTVEGAKRALESETPGFDFAAAGFPFIAAMSSVGNDISQMLLSAYKSALTLNGFEAGWTYREYVGDKTPDLSAGYITQVSLDPDTTGYTQPKLQNQIAPFDLVNVELDSFAAVTSDFGDQLKLAQRRVSMLAGHSPVIALTQETGARDLRTEVGQHLESLGYEKIAGSAHLYQPRKRDSRLQTRQARASTLLETYTESAENVITLFLANAKAPVQITENAGVLVSRNMQRSIALPQDLVPVNAYGGFGLPQGPEIGAKVRAQLTAMVNNQSRFDHLLRLSEIVDAQGNPARQRAAAQELRQSIQKYLDSADENGLPRPGTMFGTGDVLPLVQTKGSKIQILLYRHGMKAPREINDQLRGEYANDNGPAGVAIYRNEPQSLATTHTGRIINFEKNTQYGLTVNLRVPLQHLGNKIQLEANGMKYVLTSAGEKRYLPDHDLFGNGTGIDVVADLASAMSKESTGGLVNNFRNAFAYFGIDFTPELVKFFTGVDWATADARTQQTLAGVVKEHLKAIHSQAGSLPTAVVQELMQAPYLDKQVEVVLRGVALPNVASNWVSQVVDVRDDNAVETRIARAAILYMLLPQAQTQHILRAGGLNSGTDVRADGTQTVFMPRIFTEVFDKTPPGDDLRRHLFKKLNSQIDNTKAKKDQWYQLREDFTFAMRVRGGEQLEGYLQFAKAVASGDNPTLNRQAFARASRQNWSRHSLDMAYQAIGARTAAEKGLEKTARFANLRSEVAKGSLWSVLTDTTVTAGTPSFMLERPGERARRQLAYEAVGAFRQELVKDEWAKGQEEAYVVRRTEEGAKLGLNAQQSVVIDYWIRQMLGKPLGEGDQGRIGFESAIRTLDEISWNTSRHLLPVAGAQVPQLHVYDLAMLFEANRGDKPKWWLAEGPSLPRVSHDWDAWTKIAMGTGQIENALFDPMYLLATDGFMHTYQDASDTLVGLPVSRDALLATKLMDGSTDRLLQSLDPHTDRLGQDPILLETDLTTFADLMGAERLAGTFRGRQAPDSVLAKRQADRIKWRKEHGVPMPMDTTMANFRERGTSFIEESSNSNSVIRIISNLRAGNALLNPLLWVSAGPEMWYRSVLDDATTLLMGTGTGVVGEAAAGAAARAGASMRYTPQQIDQLQSLYREMGSRTGFKAMVYSSMMFKQPRLRNAGRVERWTHNYAAFASGIQDPTYGLRATSLARRYVDKVLEELVVSGSVVTTEQVIAKLHMDPEWVQKNMPEIHQSAINTLANIRSLRPTPMSLALKGIYEPASQSAHLPVNMAGNLVRIPLMFSGYMFNVLTTVTGMQGFSNILAMFMEGRNKGIIGRAQAAMQGVEPPADNRVDMKEALDGINLSKMFIQGGITHTGLFALGLAAGGLGLTGEDEEERRRRRAAQTTGGDYLYDPRRIENDWRNSDAIFLDWMPPAISSWFKVNGGDENGNGAKSMAQLPWIMKQFISPIIGMERFLDTGDPQQIVWGFADAVGSMPLFNASTWDSATAAFAELMANADDAAKSGAPEDLPKSYGYMIAALGTMERMLFENSFVNMLYIGKDRYDRDQWKRPLTDSDRDIQYDLMGNARETDALTNYRDEETGEVRAGYANRDWVDATMHQMTENRLGLALIGSLFTGGLNSSYFRENMVVKQREFQKPELSLEEAEGLVLSIMDSETYGRTAPGAVDDEGFSTELLTESGARAVFQGLYAGTVAFDSPALEGVYIDPDMRSAIQEKWMAELVLDGIQSGMDPEAAERHMWDIWLGQGTSPYGVGISEILWAKEPGTIPYNQTVKYNQLNTLYMMGPNGRPYATGVTRDGVMNLFGIAPKRYYVAGDTNVGVDQRLNAADDVLNMNLGMRGLERTDESWLVPTDEEIGESIQKAIENLGSNLGDMLNDAMGNGWVNYPRRSGWVNYGRSYGRGGGGGGGYSSSPHVADYGGQAQRMNAPRRVRSAYSDDLYSTNTSNPIIRRATIRRERFSSQRGRLNQWQ